MKIFIVVGSVCNDKGGVSAFLSDFIPSLTQFDSVEVSIIRKVLVGVKNVRFNNVIDISTEYNGLVAYISHLFKILIEILKNENAVFYVHGVWNIECIFTILLCSLTKRKVLLSPHGMLMSYPLSIKATRKAFLIRLFKMFDARSIVVILNSKLELAQMSLLNINFKKKYIIPHFIDSRAISEVCNTRSIYDELKCVRFVTVSRIDKIKGFDVTLNALSKIVKYHNFKYDIYGPVEPSYRNYLTSLIEILGLENNVKLHPPVWGGDKLHRFRDAHYSISYSHTENFGMSVLESLSVGTPVIVSQNSPWSDLANLNAGFVVSNPSEYSSVLDEACVHALSSGYSVFRENALRYSKKFEKSEIMRMYYNIFTELKENEKI